MEDLLNTCAITCFPQSTWAGSWDRNLCQDWVQVLGCGHCRQHCHHCGKHLPHQHLKVRSHMLDAGTLVPDSVLSGQSANMHWTIEILVSLNSVLQVNIQKRAWDFRNTVWNWELVFPLRLKCLSWVCSEENQGRPLSTFAQPGQHRCCTTCT